MKSRLPVEYEGHHQWGPSTTTKPLASITTDHLTGGSIKKTAEFEHTGKQLKDPNVKQWVIATLPVLKEHLTIAKNIADDLGVSPK